MSECCKVCGNPVPKGKRYYKVDETGQGSYLICPDCRVEGRRLLPVSFHGEDAIEVLWEALDGLLDDVSGKDLLELAGFFYVNGKDGTCPVCGSDDIRGSAPSADEVKAWSVVSCKECGAVWQEVFTMAECDFQYGAVPENARDLILARLRPELKPKVNYDTEPGFGKYLSTFLGSPEPRLDRDREGGSK